MADAATRATVVGSEHGAGIWAPPSVGAQYGLWFGLLLGCVALLLVHRLREASRGRFERPLLPAVLDDAWLDRHVFSLEPDRVSAIWRGEEHGEVEAPPGAVAGIFFALLGFGLLAAAVIELPGQLLPAGLLLLAGAISWPPALAAARASRRRAAGGEGLLAVAVVASILPAIAFLSAAAFAGSSLTTRTLAGATSGSLAALAFALRSAGARGGPDAQRRRKLIEAGRQQMRRRLEREPDRVPDSWAPYLAALSLRASGRERR
jgi:hypothetical protein